MLSLWDEDILRAEALTNGSPLFSVGNSIG
jgi:hypothetical protein